MRYMKTLTLLLLCDAFNIWNVTVAEPRHRFGPDSPILVVPGTATWGYSSVLSGPISLRTSDSSSVSAPTGGLIRGTVTYGTNNGRWVGKAIPIYNSPSQRVVSASFSVEGGEPGYRIFDPYGSANGTPTLIPPTVKPIPQRPPTVQPQTVRPLPARPPPLRPPFLPHPSATFIPRVYRWRPFPYFPRNFTPQRMFFRVVHGKSPHVEVQRQSLTLKNLLMNRALVRKGHTEIVKRFPGDKLHSRSGGTTPRLGSASFLGNIEQGKQMSRESISDDHITSSEKNKIIANTFPDDLGASNFDETIPNEISSTDQRDDAITFSSQKTISVNERDAGDINFLTEQTASSTGRSTLENSGVNTSIAPIQDISEINDLPDDQTVVTSIDVKPVESGTLVVYYEDTNSSSYPSSHETSPVDPIDIFAVRNDSFSNTPSRPGPLYIIVKDPNFSRPITVLSTDGEVTNLFSDDRKGTENTHRDFSSIKQKNRPPAKDMSTVNETRYPPAFKNKSFLNEHKNHVSDDMSSSDEQKDLLSTDDKSTVENKVISSKDVSVDENCNTSTQKDKSSVAKVLKGTKHDQSSSTSLCGMREGGGTSTSSSGMFKRNLKAAAFGHGLVVTLWILL